MENLDEINDTADATRRKRKTKYIGEIVYFV